METRMQLPVDLKPLPTAPWDERPPEVPLEIEEARTALWASKGNITKAAVLLKVPPTRLRSFVKKSSRLTREADEAREQLADLAEGVVYEALTDAQDATRRDAMARFVLKSPLAKDRGYGSGSNGGAIGISIPGGSGSVQITWEGGAALGGAEANTIDGQCEEITSKEEENGS